ncbi:MAG: EAL domain-containing protein [Betaproteobacteria bacterium]|nr:EAL domain-containing protein [Betaproteobacteria bacterium]
MNTNHSDTAPWREPTRPVAQAFGLLATALFALALFYAMHVWQSVQRERSTELANVVALASRSAELALQRYEELLPVLAGSLREARDTEQVQAHVADYRQALPGVIAVDLFKLDGTHVTSDAAEDAPAFEQRTVDLHGRARNRSLVRRQGLVPGRPVWWSNGSGWALPVRVVAGSRSGSDEPEFIVSALLDTRRLESLWGHLQLPADTRLGLVSDSGDAVWRMPAEQAESAGGAHSNSPFWQRLRDAGFPASGEFRNGGVFSGDREGYLFHRMGGYPLTAFVAVPRHSLWATWLDRVQLPIALFALALAGLVFAAAWSHRQQRTRESERDVAETVLREQETEIQRQAALLDQTQRAARVGGWELDTVTGGLYWTDETHRIHETEPGQYTPSLEGALDFCTPESRETLRSAVERSVQSAQSWDADLELVTAQGRRIWVRVTGHSDAGPSGLPLRVSGSYQDVTDRHRADEQIRRLAQYDELTSLANRNLFTHHLMHAIARAERYGKHLAVLFVDLDRFKNINDTLGHDTGDMVLKAMARRLSENMRQSDLVARLGGDEFVVVADELEDIETVTDIAQKLLTVIEQPVVYQAQELALTASVGIATYPQDGRDLQSLLKHADIAMYRAKDQGKNRFAFYSSGMHTTNVDRLSLEAQLKKAVVEQTQFVLHYQPKVSVREGRIIGAEALVRWVSPDRGLVPPNEFIPIAEETGLISSIGEWVLESACRQAAAWVRKGLPPVRVAVNLSARQFYSPGFIDSVRRILAESEVRPGAIELELTESMMMQNVQHVADLLMELKLLGLHISVDDFGTGYSSLGYLKRLPLDALKIDRSFVRDVPGDQDDVAITSAVVALAHSLRLKVVAEGVETDEQLAFLRELGCDEIQGFLFSKPVPAEDFEDLLRRDVRLGPAAARNAA